MKNKRTLTTIGRYERSFAKPPRKPVLRLYVSGGASASRRAIESVKALFDPQLKGRYQLKVFDASRWPECHVSEFGGKSEPAKRAAVV